MLLSSVDAIPPKQKPESCSSINVQISNSFQAELVREEQYDPRFHGFGIASALL